MVEQAMRGDREAFGWLVGQIGDRMYAIATRILRDTYLACATRISPRTPCRARRRQLEAPEHESPSRRRRAGPDARDRCGRRRALLPAQIVAIGGWHRLRISDHAGTLQSGPGRIGFRPTGERPAPGLVGTWLGPTRPIFGSSVGGSKLTLSPTSTAMFALNVETMPLLRADASTAGGDLGLVATVASAGCQVGDVGTYPVTVSASGQSLMIAPGSDSCGDRGASIAGSWWLADCNRSDDACLGELDPGTYGSQFFSSFVAKGALWRPVYGALTFTVPDGWASDAAYPSYFSLSPAADYAATTPDQPDSAASIAIISNAVPESQATPCSGSPASGVKPGATAFIGWLRQLPGLEVGPTTASTIAGQ